jgi:RES domain-containing protein
VRLWRIGTETRTYAADDLSGAGAALRPGRWNAAGEAVVYTAPTLALAVLETAAYVDAAGLPYNRFVITIDVPAPIWRKRRTMRAASLPGGWDAVPSGMSSEQIGSRWLASGDSAVLLIPSVIVPEEFNVLINPAHADARAITARSGRRFDYNTLFRT